MRHRYAPPPTPGWGPISPPTRPSGRAGAIIQGAVPAALGTFAVLRGLPHLPEGFGAVALAAAPFLLLLGLWFVLKASPSKGRTLIEWAAVVMVVILLSNGGIAAPSVKVAADRKAPAERIAKARQDLVGLYGIWGELSERFPVLPDPPQPESAPKKGHR